MQRVRRALVLLALVIAVLTLSGCAGILSEITQAAPPAQQAGTPPSSLAPSEKATIQRLPSRAIQAAAGPLPDIASVAEAVRSAVVSIQASSLRQSFIFGIVPQEGQGSGFLIDAQGHILTNAHVVAGVERVDVTLPDGRVFKEVPVIGRDEVTDLAVLQIPEEGLPADLPLVRLGSSTDLHVGEWVIAIGNALGLGPTVTAGIVSASGRAITTDTGCELREMVQTDAAINPGNSGGPLFNLRGEVVGINTAVERMRGNVIIEGVGFAIAIDEAMPIVRELIEEGFINRPWLGVSMYTNSAALASRFDLPTDQGVLIGEVFARTPAALAGLRPGYVIQSVEGQRVDTSEGLQQAIASRRVGDQVRVGGLDRFGRSFTLRVRLGQRACS